MAAMKLGPKKKRHVTEAKIDRNAIKLENYAEDMHQLGLSRISIDGRSGKVVGSSPDDSYSLRVETAGPHDRAGIVPKLAYAPAQLNNGVSFVWTIDQEQDFVEGVMEMLEASPIPRICRMINSIVRPIVDLMGTRFVRMDYSIPITGSWMASIIGNGMVVTIDTSGEGTVSCHGTANGRYIFEPPTKLDKEDAVSRAMASFERFLRKMELAG
jgi:hypothetical protein